MRDTEPRVDSEYEPRVQNSTYRNKRTDDLRIDVINRLPMAQDLI